MKLTIVLISILMLCLVSSEENNRPVIAVLTIPMTYNLDQDTDLGAEGAFIHSQYAKFLEKAGAMVVPIHSNSPIEDIHYTLEHVNGALFTGGALPFINEDGSLSPFAAAGKIILDKVKDLNDNGVNFPLWGTCMGHQLILMLESNRSDALSSCPSSHTLDNLIYQMDDITKSDLFGSFPEYLIKASQEDKLTANFHHSGVDAARFTGELELSKTVNLLATSLDINEKPYSAITEFKDYPIYTVQFHPEVTEFTFSYNDTDHSDNAVEFMFLMSLKFISEAKKNTQSYPSHSDLISNLVQTTGQAKLSSGGDFKDNIYFNTEQISLISQ
eukprot:CAMPEP_0196998728 /NCGR_PEP_ID=MMETSP1380-20130617/4052_1 /TAXON_ID=5936 /ORGANISM="Euplotes crassus, Strain CT5" /LENGTH=328 /DNA_ID=CAMNT_0042415403 /DNA_START=1 /DNA_END=987 /DNA_ORIENTATION=-